MARYQLAQVQRALGRLDAAIQTYEQALRATAVPGRPPLPTVGLVYVGLAEVAYQRNELDSALRHVTEGIALERQFLPGTSPAAGLATLAWIRQAAGDPAGALEAMGEAGHAAPDHGWGAQPGPGAASAAAAGSGRRGRGRTVDAGDRPAAPTTSRATRASPGYLVLARVLLAQQRPAEALALLDRLHAAAVAQHRVGSVIEAGALRALALAASGQDAERGERSRRRAHAGLPAGLCPGLRRRGTADGRAADPADRGPAGRAGRRRGPARLPGPAPARL